MKAAVISPTGLLHRYSAQSDYHLCLAHLILKDTAYREFYIRAVEGGQYVILDNSVIELGRPVEFETLCAAIDILRPQEVVLCDFPKDVRATIQWAKEYGPQLKERYPSIRLMAVPQWELDGDRDEWMRCHEVLCKMPFVDVIGIPKFLRHHRPRIINLLEDYRERDVEYHLLGTWGNPIEVTGYSDRTWIRGVDTKAPVRFGQFGIVLHKELGLLNLSLREAIPAMSFEDDFDPFPVVTSHNVKTFLGWATGSKEGVVTPLRREYGESASSTL